MIDVQTYDTPVLSRAERVMWFILNIAFYALIAVVCIMLATACGLLVEGVFSQHITVLAAAEALGL